MPRTVTKKGLAASGRILDAAEILFSDKGFYGTSIRDIAGETGMPTASLLHHFPNKAKLYAAILARIAADLDGGFGGAIASRGSHTTRMRRMVRGFLAWSFEKPHYAKLLLRELLDNPQRLTDDSHLFLAGIVDQVEAFVRDGQEHGAFRGVDPSLFIAHLAGSVSYYVAASPTLRRILKRPRLDAAYRRDLEALVDRVLLSAGGPP